jgi:hypothetical protein
MKKDHENLVSDCMIELRIKLLSGDQRSKSDILKPDSDIVICM